MYNGLECECELIEDILAILKIYNYQQLNFNGEERKEGTQVANKQKGY